MTRVKHSGDFFTVLTRLSSQVIAFNYTVSFTCVFLNSFLLLQKTIINGNSVQDASPQLCNQEDLFFWFFLRINPWVYLKN